jgi:diacylglycerol kinase (ATP)
LSLKRVLVIGNPAAHGGRAKKLYVEYLDFLERKQTIEYQGYLTQKQDDQEGILSEIQNFSPDIISIIGGDGTINDVINVGAARKCDLHLIPAGSGNDFSKLINGLLTKSQAFDLIETPHRVEVDTGDCNTRKFLNGVGLGFDGSVARQTVRMKLPFSTSWKYWIAIFKNILFYRSTQIKIRVNNKELRQKIFMISVANGTEYGGGFRVSPLSDPSDGLLNLVVIGKLGPASRLQYIPIVEKGKHLDFKFVHHETIKKVEIDSEEILYAHLDGELMSSKSYIIQLAEKVRILSSK